MLELRIILGKMIFKILHIVILLKYQIKRKINQRILKRKMNATNLLSKLIKSDKLEISNELNQALDCIGIKQKLSELNRYQEMEVGKLLLEKYAGLVNYKTIAELLKQMITVDELEGLKQEISGKLSTSVVSFENPIFRKRMDALKSSFEEISGDNVL